MIKNFSLINMYLPFAKKVNNQLNVMIRFRKLISKAALLKLLDLAALLLLFIVVAFLWRPKYG